VAWILAEDEGCHLQSLDFGGVVVEEEETIELIELIELIEEGEEEE
jgi:hypothetical protein